MQDYADLIQTHRQSNADITIATHAVGSGQASFRGCCKVEADTGRAKLSARLMFYTVLLPVVFHSQCMQTTVLG